MAYGNWVNAGDYVSTTYSWGVYNYTKFVASLQYAIDWAANKIKLKISNMFLTDFGQPTSSNYPDGGYSFDIFNPPAVPPPSTMPNNLPPNYAPFIFYFLPNKGGVSAAWYGPDFIVFEGVIQNIVSFDIPLYLWSIPGGVAGWSYIPFNVSINPPIIAYYRPGMRGSGLSHNRSGGMCHRGNGTEMKTSNGGVQSGDLPTRGNNINQLHLGTGD